MIEQIREHWNNPEDLHNDLLEMVEKQLTLASSIASQEQLYNSTFITEREDMFKGTDTMARAKAKSLVGPSKTQYEYEFNALNNLIGIVTLRISQIPGGLVQVLSHQPPSL